MLLEFDKSGTKRTKVIEDGADYFSDNKWMKKEEREALVKRDNELREKRNVSQLHKKFTLDFFGRRVVEEEQQDFYNPEDEVVQPIMDPPRQNNRNLIGGNPLLDPRLKVLPPKYESSELRDSLNVQHKLMSAQPSSFPRVQDVAFQEITDTGLCLSMHQPSASLLVHGIKKLEGRSWYTAHRGRLWIASTGKLPDEHEIRRTEERYRCLYPDDDIEFPKIYPSGTLLGCVNLVDCITKGEYFSKNPDAMDETDSAYLFVCESPEELPVKFSVKGKVKPYKLEKHVHDAAKKHLLSGRHL